jgi:hypothetical protein
VWDNLGFTTYLLVATVVARFMEGMGVGEIRIRRMVRLLVAVAAAEFMLIKAEQVATVLKAELAFIINTQRDSHSYEAFPAISTGFHFRDGVRSKQHPLHHHPQRHRRRRHDVQHQ